MPRPYPTFEPLAVRNGRPLLPGYILLPLLRKPPRGFPFVLEWEVYFACRYCLRWHTHGRDVWENYIFHRASHCFTDSPYRQTNYSIQVAGLLTPAVMKAARVWFREQRKASTEARKEQQKQMKAEHRQAMQALWDKQ
jgi:hypothetical protein